MSNLPQVGDDNFKEEILDHKGVAMVDFWAAWCAPCRMLTPIVEELASVFQGKIKIVSLDVDASTGIASQYGIQAIPTLLIFKNGTVIEQVVGMQSKDVLTAKLEQALTK